MKAVSVAMGFGAWSRASTAHVTGPLTAGFLDRIARPSRLPATISSARGAVPRLDEHKRVVCPCFHTVAESEGAERARVPAEEWRGRIAGRRKEPA